MTMMMGVTSVRETIAVRKLLSPDKVSQEAHCLWVLPTCINSRSITLQIHKMLTNKLIGTISLHRVSKAKTAVQTLACVTACSDSKKLERNL